MLLPFADHLREANAALGKRLTPQIIGEIVELIPDAWLGAEAPFASLAEQRAANAEFLSKRLAPPPRVCVDEAINARTEHV